MLGLKSLHRKTYRGEGSLLDPIFFNKDYTIHKKTLGVLSKTAFVSRVQNHQDKPLAVKVCPCAWAIGDKGIDRKKSQLLHRKTQKYWEFEETNTLQLTLSWRLGGGLKNGLLPPLVPSKKSGFPGMGEGGAKAAVFLAGRSRAPFGQTDWVKNPPLGGYPLALPATGVLIGFDPPAICLGQQSTPLAIDTLGEERRFPRQKTGAAPRWEIQSIQHPGQIVRCQTSSHTFKEGNKKEGTHLVSLGEEFAFSKEPNRKSSTRWAPNWRRSQKHLNQKSPP